MAWTEKCRGCMYENACVYITCRIEHEKEIKNRAIDEFAEKLTAHFNDWLYQETPSNDDETDRTRHIICDTICDAIGGISEIAEQMKGV